MPFFQNPFPDEFRGNWLLGDRHHVPTFIVKGNAGRGKEIVYAWNRAPYNLSGSDADGNPNKYLSINYSLHNRNNWATMKIDLTTTCSSPAAVQASEVISALAATPLFVERFNASYGSFNDSTTNSVMILSRLPVTQFNFYILNGAAESVLGFNQRAGVAELPTYFERHTIDNRFIYGDSVGMIIQLTPTTANVDADIIDNAADPYGKSLGYVHTTVHADWELLGGKSGLFTFQKGPSAGPVDGTKTTTIITYPAGAKTGDLAEQTVTQYDSSSAIVAVFQMPYTLTDSDLVTPP
jgi:hypothetical protein